MNLTHENNLIREINNLSASGKIQNSVGLTAQDAKSGIEKLVQIIRQRFNAVQFYFSAIQNLDINFYFGIQAISSTELKLEWSSASKSFINFTDSDFDVQISLLNSGMLVENSALIIFIVLQSFFSNLISLEDCIAKIINIAYDLIPSEDRPSYIRRALDNRMSTSALTLHLRTFHAIGQDGKPDKTGSTFNIAKTIRNQLMHDDIDGVMVSSSPISLSGFPTASKLHFRDSFFPPNTDSANTEMVTFCQNAYDETVNFVNECYRLIYADLQQSGVLPI